VFPNILPGTISLQQQVSLFFFSFLSYTVLHFAFSSFRGSFGAAYPFGIDIDMIIERIIAETTTAEIDFE